MCIAVQIQYSAAYKVKFLWQFTVNMQHEDKKFIQHKIQYTVAQCRVGVEVSREKRPNEQKFKKGGGNLVFVLLRFNYSNSTIYIYIYIYIYHYYLCGKIQGDGRKFLDSFKSYFGSQILSHSLNGIHIMYPLQPKSATKGKFFPYIFVFVSSWCMLPLDIWLSFPVTSECFLIADVGKAIVLMTQCSQISNLSVHFPWVFNSRSLLMRPLI